MARSQTGQVLLLLGALLGSAVVVVPVAYVAQQQGGAVAALVAWVTCVVSGLAAWGLVQLFSVPHSDNRSNPGLSNPGLSNPGSGNPVPGNVAPQVLLGMFPRMGIPLAVCMIAYLKGGALADAGFVYYILVFYFVTLVVETVLQVGAAHERPTEKSTV
jgi:hypothetical protein